MFKPRTTPLEYGEQPWKWDVDSVYQCTWYCFWRFFQVHGLYPCYQNGETKTGSYNNGNTWLKNVRSPIEAKDIDYNPVAGDVAVYDWDVYGHVIFLETNTLTSEYRNGNPNSFRNANLGDFKGQLLGYLHNPYEPINPVQRNENVAQIKTTDDTLRIRIAPSLKADIVGHVQLGYYNVLDTHEEDGYTWYEIAKDRWCANITTIYLPKNENDMVEQIRKWADAMINDVNEKQKKIETAEADFKKIEEISKRWV